MSITERKQDHIELCLNEDVASKKRNFWDEVELPHCACPDISLSEINLSTKFLGREYRSPLLISSMTGGTPDGLKLNLRLAALSAHAQIPMGVGSQRIALESESLENDFKAIKSAHPKSRLWANLGLVQLNYGVTSSGIKKICEMIEAEVLILHLNPLQEALQPGGDTNFSGLFKKFESIRKEINLPIIIKETGSGMDTQSATRFVNCGADAIDVAGLGGTHWGYIEARRNPQIGSLAEAFRNWGIPTPRALADLKRALPQTPLIASGGITHGVEAAKALHLGATLAGMAKSYLLAAAQSEKALGDFHTATETALKISLFCTNRKTWSV
jgi:isopentenyl-diphosphate Delta-isomerase